MLCMIISCRVMSVWTEFKRKKVDRHRTTHFDSLSRGLFACRLRGPRIVRSTKLKRCRSSEIRFLGGIFWQSRIGWTEVEMFLVFSWFVLGISSYSYDLLPKWGVGRHKLCCEGLQMCCFCTHPTQRCPSSKPPHTRLSFKYGLREGCTVPPVWKRPGSGA